MSVMACWAAKYDAGEMIFLCTLRISGNARSRCWESTYPTHQDAASAHQDASFPLRPTAVEGMTAFYCMEITPEPVGKMPSPSPSGKITLDVAFFRRLRLLTSRYQSNGHRGALVPQSDFELSILQMCASRFEYLHLGF